jgi:hypothetical protein
MSADNEELKRNYAYLWGRTAGARRAFESQQQKVLELINQYGSVLFDGTRPDLKKQLEEEERRLDEYTKEYALAREALERMAEILKQRGLMNEDNTLRD